MTQTELEESDTLLDISAISLDLSTQTRAKTNPATIARYAERMRAGDKFPPLVVYLVEGKHLLADGFHRLLAAQEIGLTTFPAQIREGTRKDFIAFAVGANAGHGLPQSNADKRRAVELAMTELTDLSDHAIAQACKVSQPFVSRLRKQLKTVISSGKRVGRDGKARKLPRRKEKPEGTAHTATTSPLSPATEENPTPMSGAGSYDEPHPNGAGQHPESPPFEDLRESLVNQLNHARTICPAERQVDLHRFLSQYVKETWPQYNVQRGMALVRAGGK